MQPQRSQPDEPALALRGIAKGFGGTRVLRGVDLEVREGEFLSLVGPSGCGKSTLLRIIAGLETQDAGALSIGGRDVTDVDPSDRDLAMVFQSYALYPHMTVAENIATPLRMRRLPRAARLPLVGRLVPGQGATRAGIAEAVREAAEALQITPLLDRRPAQLSGGQRQRVALARALVRDPAAFLMDEPLSNLDAKLRAHMRAELAELHRRLGATFVYVTHDQIEAMTMSDRVALMDGGEIAQLGAPAELYDAPATLTVARFIGAPQMNLLPVEVSRSGVVELLGRPTALAAPGPAGPATLGIRAEDLALDPAGWEARALRVEPHGADRFVTLEIPGSGLDRLALRQYAGAAPPPADGRVRIGFAPGRAHLFGADGRRRPALQRAEAPA